MPSWSASWRPRRGCAWATRWTRRPTSARWSTSRPPTRTERWVREAVAEGARVLLGGTADGALVPADGHRRCRPSARRSARRRRSRRSSWRSRSATSRRAFAEVNDSRFGLQAGVFTNDLAACLAGLRGARGRRRHRQRRAHLSGRPHALRRRQGQRPRSRGRALGHRGHDRAAHHGGRPTRLNRADSGGRSPRAPQRSCASVCVSGHSRTVPGSLNGLTGRSAGTMRVTHDSPSCAARARDSGSASASSGPGSGWPCSAWPSCRWSASSCSPTSSRHARMSPRARSAAGRRPARPLTSRPASRDLETRLLGAAARPDLPDAPRRCQRHRGASGRQPDDDRPRRGGDRGSSWMAASRGPATASACRSPRPRRSPGCRPAAPLQLPQAPSTALRPPRWRGPWQAIPAAWRWPRARRPMAAVSSRSRRPCPGPETRRRRPHGRRSACSGSSRARRPPPGRQQRRSSSDSQHELRRSPVRGQRRSPSGDGRAPARDRSATLRVHINGILSGHPGTARALERLAGSPRRRRSGGRTTARASGSSTSGRDGRLAPTCCSPARSSTFAIVVLLIAVVVGLDLPAALRRPRPVAGAARGALPRGPRGLAPRRAHRPRQPPLVPGGARPAARALPAPQGAGGAAAHRPRRPQGRQRRRGPSGRRPPPRGHGQQHPRHALATATAPSASVATSSRSSCRTPMPPTPSWRPTGCATSACGPPAGERVIPFSGGISSVPQLAADRTDALPPGRRRAVPLQAQRSRHGRGLRPRPRPACPSDRRSRRAVTVIRDVIRHAQPDARLPAHRRPARRRRPRLRGPHPALRRARPSRTPVSSSRRPRPPGGPCELDLACFEVVAAGSARHRREPGRQHQPLAADAGGRRTSAPPGCSRSWPATASARAASSSSSPSARPSPTSTACVATSTALQHAGVRIAADDVGAGNAGLRLLSQLRFDIVKIDLSLVQDGAQHDSSRNVVRSLMDLAARQGAVAIAEGLETAEQLRSLRELGITTGQGYLLGRPGRNLGLARSTSRRWRRALSSSQAAPARGRRRSACRRRVGPSAMRLPEPARPQPALHSLRGDPADRPEPELHHLGAPRDPGAGQPGARLAAAPRRPTPRAGFLCFSAILAGVIGLGWLATEWGLPAPTELAIERGRWARRAAPRRHRASSRHSRSCPGSGCAAGTARRAGSGPVAIVAGVLRHGPGGLVPGRAARRWRVRCSSSCWR